MTDNELIAEFMEVKHRKCFGPLTGAEYTEIRDGHKWTLCTYHNSWDALMPVVEKIECHTPYSGSNNYRIKIEAEECKINEEVGHEACIVPLVESKTKIEAVYKAVIEFIKWYNENK